MASSISEDLGPSSEFSSEVLGFLTGQYGCPSCDMEGCTCATPFTGITQFAVNVTSCTASYITYPSPPPSPPAAPPSPPSPPPLSQPPGSAPSVTFALTLSGVSATTFSGSAAMQGAVESAFYMMFELQSIANVSITSVAAFNGTSGVALTVALALPSYSEATGMASSISQDLGPSSGFSSDVLGFLTGQYGCPSCDMEGCTCATPFTGITSLAVNVTACTAGYVTQPSPPPSPRPPPPSPPPLQAPAGEGLAVQVQMAWHGMPLASATSAVLSGYAAILANTLLQPAWSTTCAAANWTGGNGTLLTATVTVPSNTAGASVISTLLETGGLPLYALQQLASMPGTAGNGALTLVGTPTLVAVPHAPPPPGLSTGAADALTITFGAEGLLPAAWTPAALAVVATAMVSFANSAPGAPTVSLANIFAQSVAPWTPSNFTAGTLGAPSAGALLTFSVTLGGGLSALAALVAATQPLQFVGNAAFVAYVQAQAVTAAVTSISTVLPWQVVVVPAPPPSPLPPNPPPQPPSPSAPLPPGASPGVVLSLGLGGVSVDAFAAASSQFVTVTAIVMGVSPPVASR